MRRIIKYQAEDGKWYDKEIFDLMDPLDIEISLMNKIQEVIAKLKAKITISKDGFISMSVEEANNTIDFLKSNPKCVCTCESDE